MEFNNILKKNQIVFYLFSVLFIAISAQISIDIHIFDTEIPITGQSLAVLIVGFSTSKNKGWIAILIYLIIGFLSLPVFADGSAGIEKLFGYTGGYLIGFLVAARFMVHIRKLGWHKQTYKIFMAMFLGTLIILILGYLQLSYFLGFEQALLKGILPFLPGALVKIILGMLPFVAMNWWGKNS